MNIHEARENTTHMINCGSYGLVKQELRDKRNLLGLTQAKMAEALGLSLKQYARYERGEYPIPRPVELAVKYLTRENK